MNYIRLSRLNEHHDSQFPNELLDMKIGEFLDIIGKLDNNGDIEYEIIEDAILAVKDKVLGNGYQADDRKFNIDDSIEGEEPIESDFSSVKDEDFPTFNQSIRNSSPSSDKNNSNLNNFQF